MMPVLDWKSKLQSRIAVRYLSIALLFLIIAGTLIGSVAIAVRHRQNLEALRRLSQDQADFLASVIPEAVYFKDFLTLETLVRQMTLEQDMVYVLVVDNGGRSLTRYLNQEDPRVAAAIEEAGTRDPQVVSRFISGSSVVALKSPIITEGLLLGEVRLGYSEERVESQLFASIWIASLGVFGIALTLGVLTIGLFNWQIGRRLQELTEIAQRLALGDLDRRADIELPDEIGQLKDSFNRMADQLTQALASSKKNNLLLRSITDVQSKYIIESEPNQLFEHLLDTLLVLGQCNGGFIGEVHPDDQGDRSLFIWACAGPTRQNLAAFQTKIVGEILASQNRILFKEKDLGPTWEWGDSLVLPLFMQGRILGVVGLLDRQGGSEQADLEYLGPFLATISNLLLATRNNLNKQAVEKQLSLSEAKNRSILTTAVDAIITIDTQGIIDGFNPAAAQIFGYDPEEVIGRNVAILMTEPETSQHDTYIENYRRTGIKKIIGIGRETVGRRKDGTLFPIYLSVSELQVGAQHLFTGIIRDISAEKHAQQLIQRQRDFALQIMDNMGQGLTITDLDGKFTYVNPAYARITGYLPDELIGKSPYTITFEDDLGHLKEAQQKRLAGSITSYETRLKARGGEPVYVFITGVPFREGEKIIGSIAVVTDLTEKNIAEEKLKRSEERTRTILEMALDAVIAIDEAGLVTGWNQMAEKTFGFSRKEALGQKMGDLIIPPNFREQHEKGMKRFQETGYGPILDTRFEIVGLHKEGHEFPIELAITAVRMPQGYVFNAFVRDITSRKEAQRMMAAARDQALEASRMKSDFLAMMSHEIRTPMSGIIGMSEVLIDTELDQDQTSYTNVIVNESQALLRIVNDILDFSKIEAGKLELEAVDFYLPEVIETVIQLFSLEAQKKELSLHYELETGAGLFVVGDPGRLRQVFVNLVSNAVKFTHAGAITLQVYRQTTGVGQAEVEFVVRDTGIGMDDKLLANLFEPFEQGERSQTRRYGGTGLGLAIAKRLIGLMGGTIRAESRLEEGSAFFINIPFAVSTLEDGFESGEDPAPHEEKLGLREKVHTRPVLVVEDNLSTQLVVVEQLQRLGIPAQVVQNGSQAVRVLGQGDEDFALILMDLQMPVMDGIAATQAIRQQENDRHDRIPILAMTANVLPENRQSCLEAGMDDVINKPISMAAMRSIMEKWYFHRNKASEIRGNGFPMGPDGAHEAGR